LVRDGAGRIKIKITWKNADMLIDELFTESMKLSDVPPSLRRRLTMKDIEADRPRAFKYRVVFPDGAHSDFLDLEAARSSARVGGGRVTSLQDQTQP
jgi:ferric iron reductase protein FhuF